MNLRSILAICRGQIPRKFYDNLLVFKAEIWVRDMINRVKYNRELIVHPTNTYYVQPDVVNYYLYSTRFTRKEDIGKIIDGGWDKKRKDVCQMPIFKGLNERYNLQKDWVNTKYFKWHMEKMQEKGSTKGCRTPEEFLNERCKYVDELYNSIKEKGYIPQHELEHTSCGDTNRISSLSPRNKLTHEIGVSIGEDGEILLHSGYHRFAIAKILDLDLIPIKIIITHNNWLTKTNNKKLKEDIQSSDHPHPLIYDYK